nr:hypothetical protein [uncultured Erwinia sp.]
MPEENENNILIIVAARLARKECLTRLNDLCDLEQRVVSTRNVRDAVEHAEVAITRECCKIVRGHDMLAKKLLDAESEVARLNEQVQALAAENAALKSSIGFFSYGTDSGYEEHTTADDAIKAADSDIDYYRGDACDGWSDETNRTVWGVVIQRASMIGLHTETDDSGNKREICDYALLPIVETPSTDAILREVRADELDAIAAELVALDTVGSTGAIANVIRQKAASIRTGEVQP